MNGPIPPVTGEQAGKETCIKLRGVSIVNRNLWRAEGLDQTADEIRALALAPDGTLWVATQNGVATYNRGRFIAVDTGVKGLCLNLAFDASGHLYVESTRGILRGQQDASGLYRFNLVAPPRRPQCTATLVAKAVKAASS